MNNIKALAFGGITKNVDNSEEKHGRSISFRAQKKPLKRPSKIV